MEVNVRSACPDDLEYIRSTLADNGLPTADLSQKLEYLYVCERAGTQVGVGGLERFGDAALLRSVAIKDEFQGKGFGAALCAELLEAARAAGITEVYLLTTTAEEFFGARGFAEINRDAVPDRVRNSAEFSDLCPESAVCMKRELDDRSAPGAETR